MSRLAAAPATMAILNSNQKAAGVSKAEAVPVPLAKVKGAALPIVEPPRQVLGHVAKAFSLPVRPVEQQIRQISQALDKHLATMDPDAADQRRLSAMELELYCLPKRLNDAFLTLAQLDSQINTRLLERFNDRQPVTKPQVDWVRECVTYTPASFTTSYDNLSSSSAKFGSSRSDAIEQFHHYLAYLWKLSVRLYGFLAPEASDVVH